MSNSRALLQPPAPVPAAIAPKPRLLFFFSATCGACRRTDGFLAQVLQRRGNHDTFELVRVDADAQPALVDRFEVGEIPALLVVVGSQVHGRLTKPTGCSQIKQLLSPWLR